MKSWKSNSSSLAQRGQKGTSAAEGRDAPVLLSVPVLRGPKEGPAGKRHHLHRQLALKRSAVRELIGQWSHRARAGEKQRSERMNKCRQAPLGKRCGSGRAGRRTAGGRTGEGKADASGQPGVEGTLREWTHRVQV